MLFFQAREPQGKDRGRDKEGASPDFSTFQNLENKSNRLPRMQDTQHPTPPQRRCSEAGAEGILLKQFSRPELSLYSPVRHKTNPLQIFQLLHSYESFKGSPHLRPWNITCENFSASSKDRLAKCELPMLKDFS